MASDDTVLEPTRRSMLRAAGLSVVAVPVISACGGSDASPDGAKPTGGAPTSGAVLAKTSDIAEGGAVFLDSGIVVTQPTAGEFHAFDRTCTHRQCPVTDLQDGKIHCDCHDSLYDPATGENVGGPAPSPLTMIPITVQGDEILTS